MYLPTFWKLTAEATMYRGRHMSGYLVPVGFLGKAPLCDLMLFYVSRLGDVPLPVQLGVLLNHPTPQRCSQESSLISQMRCPHGTNTVLRTNLQAVGQRQSSKVTDSPSLYVPQSRKDDR